MRSVFTNVAMPVYLYEVINEDGTPGVRFEAEQSASSPALSAHPRTGQPARRVYTAPNLGGRYADNRIKKELSDENVQRTGFTRYERDKLTGTYHKTAGTDPNLPGAIRVDKEDH